LFLYLSVENIPYNILLFETLHPLIATCHCIHWRAIKSTTRAFCPFVLVKLHIRAEHVRALLPAPMRTSGANFPIARKFCHGSLPLYIILALSQQMVDF